MNAVTAIVFGILVGCGVHLMVRRDAVRLAAGTLLLSNAAVLLLVSAGFGERRAPILPLEHPEEAADPVVQALALTAVVISFGVTVLLMRVAIAVAHSHGTLDLEDAIRRGEAEDEASHPSAAEEGEPWR